MKSFINTFFAIIISQTMLLAQSSIQGAIEDHEGKAASQVSVQLKGTNLGVNTNEKGNFSFNNLQAGNYTLVASYVGYKTLEKNLQLAENQTLTLNLKLFENAETLKEIVVKGYVSQNERVSTVGKLAAKAMDLPISLQTLDRQVIENQQVNSLQDLLMNTNGVYIMGNSGGYQEEIAGRGYSYGSSNTFKNGVRYQNNMIPEVSSLERVEVLKGSAAMLYGNVTAGGVLNLVTKKPKFGFGGELSMRAGSFGLLKPSFDIYSGIGKGQHLAVRFNGTYQQANSFRQYVSSDRLYINPSVLAKFGKKVEVVLEADYLKDNRTPDFGAGIINYQVIDNYPRNRFTGVKWGNVSSEQLSATGTINYQISKNWKLSLINSVRDSQQLLFSNTRPNSGTLIKTDGIYTRNIQKADNFDKYYLTQADLQGTLITGKIEHQVLLGADMDNFTTTTQAYTTLNGYDKINILEDLPTNVRNDVPSMVKANRTVAPTKRFGVYAQDLLSLTQWLKVLAGVRYTEQGSKSHVTDSKGITTTTVTATKGAYSPRLGLVLQPNKCQSIFASYSNSFVLNTGVDVNGRALDPSLIDQYEVGLKNELLHKRASINVSVYQINNSNLAQISLANGNTNTNIKELAGATTSKGVEIDIQSKLTPNLAVMAGYSYNQTKFTRSNTNIVGSQLRYNPNHTANASLNYSGIKNLSLGLISTYIGQRYAGRSTRVQVANDAYRLTPIAAYTQVDATAAYFIKKISIKAKLANIANINSYNVHDDNSVNPISPRNYSLTFGYKF
jgi:iron complex outermembrane recepter protein